MIPLALVFGELLQIFAGVFEFKLGNTFGMTAFLSYGAFWWWHAFLLLLAHSHLIDISQAGPTIGAEFLLFGVLTLFLSISAFSASADHLSHIPDFVGYVCAAGLRAHLRQPRPRARWWLAWDPVRRAGDVPQPFGIVTNATFGKVVVPLGLR